MKQNFGTRLIRTAAASSSQPATHTSVPAQVECVSTHSTLLHERHVVSDLAHADMGTPPHPPPNTHTTHNSPWGDHLSCEEEFTVVPRVPRAQTYSIPLEIYVPAAVVSSACADLEDNAVPGIMRGSNPLHTSRQLFRVCLYVCTCKPFTLRLRTSISVVNGERFPAFSCSQLPDFLQL